MTSSQESLSQSILNSAPQEHMQCQLQNATQILHDVDTMQMQIREAIASKGASSQLKSKMDEIKVKLRNVNEMLQDEKKAVADLRSEHLISQSDQDSSGNVLIMMQQKASNLLCQQKRLLSAFQTHKSLMNAIREQEYENNFSEDTQLPAFDAAENNGAKKDGKILISKIPNNGTANENGQPIVSSFKVTDRKVLPYISHEALTPAIQTLVAPVMPQKIKIAYSENVNMSQDTMMITTENSMKNSIKKSNKKMQMNTGNKRSYQKRKDQQLKNQVKQTANNSKKIYSTHKESYQDIHVLKTGDVTINSQTENTKERENICHGDGNYHVIPQTDMLPFSQPQDSCTATNDVDIMKLKFVVTVKDEEFLESSAFLPENFWSTKGFDFPIEDSILLKKLDFY